MPEYVFGAPYPMTFPENKDTAGMNLGLVEPGEIRDLDEPPGRWWREATDEDRARLAAAAEAAAVGSGEESGAQEDDGTAGEGTPEPGAEDPAPDGPVPAPPAVVPGA
jgi:hypothetical protein